MLDGMARQRGVIGLQVELEMVDEIIFAQEIQASRGIGIVLMFGRLLRLRLDIQLAFEANLPLVINRHVQKRRQMVHLPLQLGVQQSRVTFASAPEDVTVAAKLVRHFHRFFHLRGGVGKHIRVATGGRAVRVARVHEQAGRAPKQFDTCAFLLLSEHFHDGIQVFVGRTEVPAFGGNVAVVKGVKRRAELFDKFEGDSRPFLRHLHRVAAVLPGPDGRADTEHVSQLRAEGVPIGDRKAELIFHRPPGDDFERVVMFKGEWVP